MQYLTSTSNAFTGYVLGSSQTQSNVSLSNGATNNISATLSPAPSTSASLEIAGSAWEPLAAQSGPSAAIGVYSDFSIFAQPYVADRYVSSVPGLFPGPPFTLLIAAAPPPSSPVPYLIDLYLCRQSVGPFVSTLVDTSLPAFSTNTNLGPLSYGDPFPAAWPRDFEYCQYSTYNLPRPNSTAVDTFIAGTNQVTSLPTAPVTPLLSPVQSPSINGVSLFQSASLNTTKAGLTWSAPATGSPIGYFVFVFQLGTSPLGTSGYLLNARYATTQTSITLPPLPANTTYVFAITAVSDAKSNFTNAPYRHQIPTARSSLISAPITLNSN